MSEAERIEIIGAAPDGTYIPAHDEGPVEDARGVAYRRVVRRGASGDRIYAYEFAEAKEAKEAKNE